MLEELGSTIVEDLLLERTKFASYLMKCAYTLSSDQIDPYHSFHSDEISPELSDMYQLLRILCQVCTERAKSTNDALNVENIESETDVYNLSQIPFDIMKNVANRVEEKFLEVVLDNNHRISNFLSRHNSNINFVSTSV